MTGPAVVVPPEQGSLRILVTVGTDHHPFDRLVGWTNDWLAGHPEQVPGCFVQSGAASVVPACPGSPFLSVDQLSGLLDAADVIVCHGGPATIADAWARGRLPIVVPRKPELGEHVDDHQVDFCGRVEELGQIRLARTAAELAGFLDEAAADSSSFHARFPETNVAAAVVRLEELVEELVSRPRRRLPMIYRGRQARRPAAGTGAPAGTGIRPPEPTPAASTNWHAHRETARTGLAGTANEEQE